MKVRDLGWERILREISEMDGREVTAGLHEEDASAGQEPNEVQRGVYNEFGTDKAPARSFVRSTHDSKKRDWANKMTRDFNDLLEGRVDPSQLLENVGSEASQDIRNTAVNMTDPPNAPSTIRKKGFDDPLVETGQMVNAINYKIR